MIHILLPVHNRARVTEAFVEALAAQHYRDFRLILIDDGCTDDTVVIVKNKIPAGQLCVLRGDGNLWWAGALQLGFNHLASKNLPASDAVLIINDDICFEPDFLLTGLQVLSEYPRAAIQAVGRDLVTGAIDRGAKANLMTLKFTAATIDQAANCLSTRGLLMSAPVFMASGGFRPDHLPHYLSDYEYTIRLKKRGTQLLCDDRFCVSVRLELTGYGDYRADGLSAFWSEAFSNRAKYNPLNMSKFVLLACPIWVIPIHLVRIWLRFSHAAVRAAFGKINQ